MRILHRIIGKGKLHSLSSTQDMADLVRFQELLINSDRKSYFIDNSLQLDIRVFLAREI